MSVEVFSIFIVSIVSVSDNGSKFWFSCLMADREGRVQSVSVVVVIFMDLDFFYRTVLVFACGWQPRVFLEIY